MREAYQNEEDLKAVNDTLEDMIREGDECWPRIAKKLHRVPAQIEIIWSSRLRPIQRLSVISR